MNDEIRTFDVPAFLATFPNPELIRMAIRDLKKQSDILKRILPQAARLHHVTGNECGFND